MKTERELQTIYEQHCSHDKGLKAVFEAGMCKGVEYILHGSDDTSDAQDTLEAYEGRR